MGLGVTHCRSSKQKINTKISTWAALVGAIYSVPYSIWAFVFMNPQGYPNKSKRFFQDNQSAMTVDINRRISCTVNSRHIDIIYFFIKGRVEKGELGIIYFRHTL